MQEDDDLTRARAPATPTLRSTPKAVTLPEMASIPGGDAYVPRAGTAPNALGPGFRLREFEIERVIGEGGFSIVYLAIDTQLGRRVAIKEYMPSALALRTGDLVIVPKSERVRETFAAGLRSFVNEARLLAQFDHPSLVKVYRFWEERGTAYMVMPYYEAVTLSQWRRRHGAPGEAWLRQLLDSLLDALGQLHGQNCYHRDIAPDNILLLPGDHPVLLDLGAARRIIGDMTQALTVILKPGYAPVEQYAEVESMRQGAWTDLYALAAVLYFMIAGRSPPPAVARMVTDEMRPARAIGAGRYSDELLSAIDAALAVLPDKRPQDLAALRALLAGSAAQFASTSTTILVRPASATAGHAATPSQGAAPPDRGSTAQTTVPRARSRSGGTSDTSAAPAASAAFDPGRSAAHASVSSTEPAAAFPHPARASAASLFKPRVVAVGLALMLAAGAGAWLLMRNPDSASVPQATATQDAPAAPLAAPSPHDVLARLHDARSPSIDVRAAASATTLRVGEDKLRFAVASNVNGYVYVLLAGTDANHLYLLFPNPRDTNNALAANATMLLPRPNWEVTAAGPAGIDRVLVIVSPRPRDFAAAGLREDENFGEFSLSALAAAMARGGPGVAAGTARCLGSGPCDVSYGAAMFEVQEIDSSGAPTKIVPRNETRTPVYIGR